MKRFIPVIILIIVSAWTLRGVFASGYFPMHDDTQVARVVEMGRALSEGQFPVRWVANLGYGFGYPIYNFYGPLPYYMGGLLYALGFTGLVATKIMIAVGFVLPAFVLYVLLIPFVGRSASLVAATMYLLAPYHAVQLYVRGAVGEFWELIFWPVMLFGFLRLQHITKRRGLVSIMTALGVAGAVLSHTLMGYVAMMVTGVVLVSYWAYRVFLRRFDTALFMWQIGTYAMGLGLSAFFWLPAFVEMGYTNVSGQVGATAYFADHFVCLPQLWTSVWGFGGSAKGCLDGMSFALGKVHVMLAASGIVLMIMTKKRKHAVLGVSGILLFLTGTYLATSYSRALWDALPGFAYLQYPWRFLSVSVFGMSVLTAFLIVHMPVPVRRIASAVIVAGVIVANMKWFVPQFTYAIDSSKLERPQDIRWRVSRISDEYLPAAFERPRREDQVAPFDTMTRSPAVRITPILLTATQKRFVVEATASGVLALDVAHFPGWRYFVEGKEVYPQLEDGRPVLSIPAGQSVTEAKFTDTPVRRIGNIITLLSVSLGLVYMYEYKRKVKR